MVRNHGLTIDSLVAADIVTAGGQVLRLSGNENPDLFWAIRGGGGNFGVVTHLEFIAQPATAVHAGMITYSVDDVPALLRGWSDAHRAAPEELNSTLVLMPAFGAEMPAMAMGLVCFAGADQAAADAALAPLLALDNRTEHGDHREGLRRCPGRGPTATGGDVHGHQHAGRVVSAEVIAAVADEWYASARQVSWPSSALLVVR